MKTETDENNDKARVLVDAIFSIFEMQNPPLGVAAYATSVVLVQLAFKVGVSKKELLESVRQTWTQQRAASQKLN